MRLIFNRRNILYSLVLCGTGKKPDFNTFLKPFVDEINSLFQEGIEWKDHNGKRYVSKVAAVICTCDSSARYGLLNMTQYNGTFGCTFCYNFGESMRKPGSLGNIRVFPQKHPVPPLRTHEETAELAKQAAESGKICNGGKRY